MYDWLVDFSALKELFAEMFPKSSKILIVGCGNAPMSEDMYDDGF
jgi:hypothetical protein